MIIISDYDAKGDSVLSGDNTGLRRNQYKLHGRAQVQSSESFRKACDIADFAKSFFASFFSLRYATRCVSFTTATVDTKHPGLASISMMFPTISRRSRGRTVLWIRRCARSNGIYLNINQCPSSIICSGNLLLANRSTSEHIGI